MAGKRSTTINVNIDPGSSLLITDAFLRAALRSGKEEQTKLREQREKLKETPPPVGTEEYRKWVKKRIEEIEAGTITAPYVPEKFEDEVGPQPQPTYVSLLPEGQVESGGLIGRSRPAGTLVEHDYDLFGVKNFTGCNVFKDGPISYGGRALMYPGEGPFGANAFIFEEVADPNKIDYGADGIVKYLPQYKNKSITFKGDQTTEVWHKFEWRNFDFSYAAAITNDESGVLAYLVNDTGVQSPACNISAELRADIYNYYGTSPNVVWQYFGFTLGIVLPCVGLENPYSNISGKTIQYHYRFPDSHPAGSDESFPPVGATTSVLYNEIDSPDYYPITLYPDPPLVNGIEWYHVAIVHQANDGIIYLNGKRIASYPLHVNENLYVAYYSNEQDTFYGNKPYLRLGRGTAYYDTANGFFRYPDRMRTWFSGYRWVPRAVYKDEFTPRRPTARPYP